MLTVNRAIVNKKINKKKKNKEQTTTTTTKNILASKTHGIIKTLTYIYEAIMAILNSGHLSKSALTLSGKLQKDKLITNVYYHK